MAGGNQRQTKRGTTDRLIRRGGSSRRSGDGSSGSGEPARQSTGIAGGGRHYSAYAASSANPRPPININQPPPMSSAHHLEDEEAAIDPRDEEIMEEEMREEEDVDAEDYTSIISRAEEYQRQPGREGLPWLNPMRPPQTLWFMDNEVAGTVTNCIQSYFKSPITSWSKGNMKHYSQWFLAFAQKYNWEPSITFTVWELFKLKAISRLKDNTCTLKKNYGSVGDKARPNWIVPRVWNGIKEYWGRTTSISRALKNSQSRAQNTSKHTSGPIGFYKRQIMEADEDGNVPPLHDIFKKVHQRKDGTYITTEAEQVVEQTQQLIEERSTQMSPGGSSVASTNVLSIPEQDAIFKQVAPKNKKGKIVGLGSIQNPAYNCRSATSQYQGFVSAEAWQENQATIKALQDEVQSSRASVQELKAEMEEMRLMFRNQGNFQHQSQGYRPMAPPTYDPCHGNAGPSTSAHDPSLDLSEHNIDLALDAEFDFPDIHQQNP